MCIESQITGLKEELKVEIFSPLKNIEKFKSFKVDPNIETIL